MGHGDYSHAAHEALLNARRARPVEKVFQQRECHPLMNPQGMRLRECRDSAEHPRSLGIVFALDVTGSMGRIPQLLAAQELPRFMRVLEVCQVPDPQLLFMAVGDATCDRAPLQVGQFESTAQLMDQWLTWCFLEAGGGGNRHESYELAMYFLAAHTEMDCAVKRNQRGYLFITGDEEPYPVLSRHVVETVIGDKLDEDVRTEEVLAELQKTFTPFFVIPEPGSRNRCESAWRTLLGDHVLVLGQPSDICFVAAGAILLESGLVQDLDGLLPALTAAGLPGERQGAVLSTLRPLARRGAGGGPTFWDRLFGRA